MTSNLTHHTHAPHRAPEQWEGRGIGAPADIWALGATALHMLDGNPPWHGLPMPQICRKITTGTQPAMPPGLPPAVTAVLASCLTHDPHARPSAASLVATFAGLCGQYAPLAPMAGVLSSASARRHSTGDALLLGGVVQQQVRGGAHGDALGLSAVWLECGKQLLGQGVGGELLRFSG